MQRHQCPELIRLASATDPIRLGSIPSEISMFSGYRTMLIFSSFVCHCSIFLRFSLGKGVYSENFYCFVLSLHNIKRSFKPCVCFDLVPDRKQLSLLHFVYIWSKQTRNYSFCFFHYKFVSLGRQCMGHAEMTLTVQATLQVKSGQATHFRTY